MRIYHFFLSIDHFRITETDVVEMFLFVILKISQKTQRRKKSIFNDSHIQCILTQNGKKYTDYYF